ncbi:MAG: hypothetical protein FD143_2267 [Ignavibacteria bacterium]|nr:MAG: hypothetical protein FD143_2267 [Ignavibacteria bacterium]KAF0158552.1 MAG: hypothetical protein FD188_2552 [Ignavibacteria bacterium]
MEFLLSMGAETFAEEIPLRLYQLGIFCQKPFYSPVPGSLHSSP